MPASVEEQLTHPLFDVTGRVALVTGSSRGMLTKGMCADWAGAGLQVNGLGPRYIETELTRPLVEDPDFDAWVRGRTPAGRWETSPTSSGRRHPASSTVVYVDGEMVSVV